jgi:hypothetical protein
MMQNLLTIYLEWPEEGEMGQYTAEISAVQIICGTLLAIAGIRLQPTLISLIKPAMIQDKYKERKEARLALDQARKSCTLQCFREAILAACSNNTTSESDRQHSHGKELDQLPATTKSGCNHFFRGKT